MMMTTRSKLDGADTAHSAIVEDHPYEPKNPDQPWSLCKHCNLAQATHQETTGEYKVDAPIAVPPEKLPPGARRVEKGEPNPDDELPVSSATEIPMVQAQEFLVKKEPVDMTCWRCKKVPGRMLPENGAILCPGCEAILKP
jgi:hypothetical protein